ncbi:ankyrin repeat domain-containing protein [Bordetella sp. 15P40C-2]|uniref:ankyrin repeat domain-containing protein n=1 Tax=Bordetella sp. 15P40C-2 TaxID=2572246 RepID=UPI001328BDE2|nr:ankyrin repeat domain-containing protein [Bordetella sp. 15P40C-2]MVW72990.1 hypothetical protein [Bordetella sp. 15P40C-2]
MNNGFTILPHGLVASHHTPVNHQVGWRALPGALSAAVKHDDLDAFKSLVDQAPSTWGVSVDTCRKRYFLAAVQAGSLKIVRHLIERCAGNVVHQRDSHERAPLLHAVCAPTRQSDGNLPLVETLIAAGARDGLSKALAYAADGGHRATAKRLIEAGADAVLALALIAHIIETRAATGVAAVPDNAPTTQSIHGAKFLMSLGVTPGAAALETIKSKLAGLRTLILLGAPGADLLAEAALNERKFAVQQLVDSGADTVSTLIKLITIPQAYAAERVRNPVTKTRRFAAIEMLTTASERATGTPTNIVSDALIRLANSRNLPAVDAILDFARPADWVRLLRTRDYDAIRTMDKARHWPYRIQLMFQECLRQNDLGAIKAWVESGNDANRPLYRAAVNGMKDDSERAKAIDYLIAAEAYLDRRKKYVIERMDQNYQENAVLLHQADDVQRARLFNAVDRADVLLVSLLLRQQADVSATISEVLKHCINLPLDTLIRSGVASGEWLKSRVKVGDTSIGYPSSELCNPAEDALFDLVRTADYDTAKRFIPNLTDGMRALAEAARRGDMSIAKRLIELGANGPAALVLCLRRNELEAASRLAGWGVDLTDALCSSLGASDFGSPASNAAVQLLRRLGADISRALLLGVERGSMVSTAVFVCHRSAAHRALGLLVRDDSLPMSVKQVRVQSLLTMGIDSAPLMEELARESLETTSAAVQFAASNHLRFLVGLGQAHIGLFMDLGKRGERLIAQEIMAAGAEDGTVTDAIRCLEANGEFDAANALNFAREMAKTAPGSGDIFLDEVVSDPYPLVWEELLTQHDDHQVRGGFPFEGGPF